MLEIKNLTLNAGETILVDNLSFTLAPGKTLAIVGESGSGKSITALAIMGLLPKQVTPISGQIIFNSNNLLNYNSKQWQQLRGSQISMIFQEPMTSLNPLMYCGLQVTEVLMLHEKINFSAARKKTLALFEEVQLPRVANLFSSYPHQLSGGQKQRVMIATALACNPQVIIADEPTTALDATVQHGIVDLLMQMQKNRGCSILFITHDLNLTSRIAHDILVMQKGKMVEYNTNSEISDNPQQAYTKALWECRPGIEIKKDWLPTLEDNILRNTTPAISPIKKIPDESLLEIKDIEVVYEKKNFIFGKSEYFPALKNINLTIYKGETLAIVGESGSGKTTLGKVLLRMEEHAKGSITYNGENILNISKQEFKIKFAPRMQMVFQDPFASLNPQHSIGEAIMEPMLVHRIYSTKAECKKQTLMLLAKTGLPSACFNRYPHEFSGGQRQRIVIARALALKPEFIILDEAVSALDVSVQAQILNLLKQLQLEFGLTYLFITHDLSVVRFIANRVAVLNNGELQEIALADDLFNSPQSAYTKHLLANVN